MWRVLRGGYYIGSATTLVVGLPKSTFKEFASGIENDLNPEKYVIVPKSGLRGHWIREKPRSVVSFW